MLGNLGFGFLVVLAAALVFVCRRRAAAARELSVQMQKQMAREEEFAAVLRQLGQFRSVTHDVRSPLQTVIGYIQLLAAERAGELNEKQRDYVEKTRIGAMQVLAVIEKFQEIKVVREP
ncbi:MAG: hypothetical protein DMG59_09930 [Acidobacteria bacterium]|nr:MAG: hypothetical protein DMG59_09930 [Acidobacteriota bacterium]